MPSDQLGDSAKTKPSSVEPSEDETDENAHRDDSDTSSRASQYSPVDQGKRKAPEDAVDRTLGDACVWDA